MPHCDTLRVVLRAVLCIVLPFSITFTLVRWSIQGRGAYININISEKSVTFSINRKRDADNFSEMHKQAFTIQHKRFSRSVFT